MARLPFVGQTYRYSGQDERKRQKIADKNRMIAAAAKIANQLAADNPNEIQQIYFADIAHKLGCDVEIVRYALSDGGSNGITFRVTERDRELLTRYKSTATTSIS